MVPHPHPDDLTLLAMGEPTDRPIDNAIDAHLAGCEQCRAEVEATRRTVELAELSNYGAGTRQPGEHVWNAIAAELGFGTAQRTNGSTHQPRPGAGAGHDVALDVGRDIDLRGDRSIDLVTPPLDGVTPDPPDQDHAETSAATRPATLRAVPGARSPTPRPTDPVPAARRWPR